LKEHLPIRQLAMILETLGDCATQEKNPILRAESVRHRMARSITHRYTNAVGELQVMQLDAALENTVREAMQYTQRGLSVNIPPSLANKLCEQIEAFLAEGTVREPILLVPSEIRPAVRQLTDSRLPRLTVLGFCEIMRTARIRTMVTIGEEVAFAMS
jgi:flagellar biosynthesis protein FlhA